MTNRDHNRYEIGYRRPPHHSKYPKGKSGNPTGRPKGIKNFQTEIQEELNARLAIVENGKRKKIKKRKAIAKQLVNKAVAGDPKVIPLLLNEMRSSESGQHLNSSEAQTSAEDERVMKSIVRRIRDSEAGSSPPETETSPSMPSAPGTDGGKSS